MRTPTLAVLTLLQGLTACGPTAHLDPPIPPRPPSALPAPEDRTELDRVIDLEIAGEHAEAAAGFARVAESAGPSGWLWLRAAHAARRAGRSKEAFDFGRRAVDDFEHQTGRSLRASVGATGSFRRHVSWLDETTIAILEDEQLLLRSALDGELLAGLDVDASGGAARGGGAFAVCGGSRCRFLSSVSLQLETAVVHDDDRILGGIFDGAFATAHDESGRKARDEDTPRGTVVQISGFGFHDLASRFPGLLPTHALHAVSSDGALLAIVDGLTVTLSRSEVDRDADARVVVDGKFDASGKVTDIELAGKVAVIATENGSTPASGLELVRARTSVSQGLGVTTEWMEVWRKATECRSWTRLRLMPDGLLALCQNGALTRFDVETGAPTEPFSIRWVDDVAVGPGACAAAIGRFGELGVLLGGVSNTHASFDYLGTTELEVRKSEGVDVLAWDTGTGYTTLSLPTGAISRFQSSENLSAIASDGRVVRGGAVEAPYGSRKLLGGARGVIAWSRNEQTIAAVQASRGSTDVQLFESASGRLLRTLHVDGVLRPVRFIDRDRALLCERVTRGPAVALLARVDLTTGNVKALLEAKHIIDARTSPNGDLVAVASRGTISALDFDPVDLAIIEARTGAVLRRGATSGVSSLAVSDSGLVAYATLQGVGFWRPGEQPSVLEDTDKLHGFGTVALTSDGRSALVLRGGTLTFHDTRTGEVRLQRPLHRDAVRSEVVVDPRSGRLEDRAIGRHIAHLRGWTVSTAALAVSRPVVRAGALPKGAALNRPTHLSSASRLQINSAECRSSLREANGSALRPLVRLRVTRRDGESSRWTDHDVKTRAGGRNTGTESLNAHFEPSAITQSFATCRPDR